jgi:hypothetical protein
MSSLRPILPGIAPALPNALLLPDDVAHAVYGLVARHTNAARVAIYPLPVAHVVAIHTGQRVTTESAAIVHEHLRALLQNYLEPAWLLVDTRIPQLTVLPVQRALAELIV